MTPPATDRGLSEADLALIARVEAEMADDVCLDGHWSISGNGLSALLAAARREGEGGIASRDHASDTGVALDWRPLADLPDLSYDTRVLVDREDWDSPSTFEAYELKPEALALWRDPPTHFVLLDSFTRAPPSSATPTAGQVPGMQNQ